MDSFKNMNMNKEYVNWQYLYKLTYSEEDLPTLFGTMPLKQLLLTSLQLSINTMSSF